MDEYTLLRRKKILKLKVCMLFYRLFTITVISNTLTLLIACFPCCMVEDEFVCVIYCFAFIIVRFSEFGYKFKRLK